MDAMLSMEACTELGNWYDAATNARRELLECKIFFLNEEEDSIDEVYDLNTCKNYNQENVSLVN